MAIITTTIGMRKNIGVMIENNSPEFISFICVANNIILLFYFSLLYHAFVLTLFYYLLLSFVKSF